MSEHVIERLGHHGDGIAPGPIFAPLALPGEVVTGDVEGDRLVNIRIVTPSEDRVRAPCSHFKSCGGCQLQHASDDFVAGWKQQVVQTALDANGLAAPFRPLHTSPPASRRRAVFSAKRTKKGAMAGFHARASDVVIQIPNCTLLDSALKPAVQVAEALAVAGASRRGELSVTATLSHGGLDILATGGHELDNALFTQLAAIAEQFDLARLCWGEETVALRRPPEQMFGTARVTPPPGAFLQATQDGEAALLAAVQDAVGAAPRVVDLFAGSGTFSLPLAQSAELWAIEGDKAMTDALDHGWRQAQGLKKVTSDARDLFRRPLLPDELAGYDACVIDPPRAGAEAQVSELARSGIGRIAYVSCNPVTFARDARVLVQAGYALDWIAVVDQFRWSTHVELVASLTLTSA